MTTTSRPITDYKKTVLMMQYMLEYQELSNALMEMLQEIRTNVLEDDELNKITIEIEEMGQEIKRLAQCIIQYGGKV